MYWVLESEPMLGTKKLKKLLHCKKEALATSAFLVEHGIHSISGRMYSKYGCRQLLDLLLVVFNSPIKWLNNHTYPFCTVFQRLQKSIKDQLDELSLFYQDDKDKGLAKVVYVRFSSTSKQYFRHFCLANPYFCQWWMPCYHWRCGSIRGRGLAL